MDLSSIIKDPAQQMMQDDIPGLAALLKSRQGQMLLPLLLGRRDADQSKFLDVLGGNNQSRTVLANRGMDDAQQKVEMEHAAALMKDLPDIAKAGIDPNQLTPYMPWLKRGNTVGQASDAGLDASRAYSDNQRAEVVERQVNAGYAPADNAPVTAPRFYNPGRTMKGFEALTRANGQDGKTVETLDPQNNVVMRQRTVKGGNPGNMPDAGMALPEGAVAPQAEQAIRNSNPALKTAEISRLPGNKGFVAKYKSQGKDVIVVIPSDANGRALTDKMQRAQ